MKIIRKRVLATALALGLGLGVALTAVAQPYGRGPGPGYMGGPGHMAGYGPCWQYDDEMNSNARRLQVQQRLSSLQSRLRLNAEQEKAWKDYEAVIVDNVQSMQDRQTPDFAGMSAPERLENVQQLMRERDSRMTRHLEAMKAFYATLAPEQQQIFDAEAGIGPVGTYREGRWHRRGPR